MDLIFVILLIISFALGFATAHFIQLMKRGRKAWKDAETRKVSKSAEED